MDLAPWTRVLRESAASYPLLSRRVLKAPLSDPMRGSFIIRRVALERSVHSLSGIGFKILFDLSAYSPEPVRFKQPSCVFRRCEAAEAKPTDIVSKLKAMKLPTATGLVQEHIAETQAYFALPSDRSIVIRTKISTERL